MLAIVAESCPTKIFLANPEMNRQVYREAFHLNDTEIDIIADLIPPGEMLIRKAQSSKKVRLNVDSVSYWIATNNARDNLLKREAFAPVSYTHLRMMSQAILGAERQIIPQGVPDGLNLSTVADLRLVSKLVSLSGES